MIAKHITRILSICCVQFPQAVITHLDRNVVDVQEADVIRYGLHAEHYSRGQRDEVAVERFRDERERSRGSEIALDHLGARMRKSGKSISRHKRNA